MSGGGLRAGPTGDGDRLTRRTPGILALPVKLVDSGFGPFVVSYLVCFFAQSMVLVYLVFLLQKARALMERDLRAEQGGVGTPMRLQKRHAHTTGDSVAEVVLEGSDADADAETDGAGNGNGDGDGDGDDLLEVVDVDSIAAQEARLKAGPDLHTLGVRAAPRRACRAASRTQPPAPLLCRFSFSTPWRALSLTRVSCCTLSPS